MANYFEREWRVRDAVLAWLGFEVGNGHRVPTLNAGRVAEATGWTDSPPTDREVADASNWLSDEGFLKGSGSYGGGIPRPQITAKGERFLTDERSVRDDPAYDRHTPSPYVVIGQANGAAIAISSPGAHQNVSNVDSFNKVRELADLVERASAEAEPAIVAEGRQLAGELRSEAVSASPNHGRIKGVAFQIATSFAAALGSGAGGEVLQLASEVQGLF